MSDDKKSLIERRFYNFSKAPTDFIGKVAGDIELFNLKGKVFTRFNLQVQNTSQNFKKGKPVYIPCMATGKTAQTLYNNVSAWDTISISNARWQNKKFEDKDGNLHLVAELFIIGVEFVYVVPDKDMAYVEEQELIKRSEEGFNDKPVEEDKKEKFKKPF